jgi:hypothetical protein
MGHGFVHFNVDAFHVPPEIEEQLRQLYSQYLRWWLYDSDLRKPRGWVTHSIFNDYAGILVHRDHAEWWIQLFNEAAVFTFNPYPHGYMGTLAPATAPANAYDNQ